MDRAEATGLGVAIAGHGALIAALALGLAVSANLPDRADPIEVSFVEESGLVSSAPVTSEAPAPSFGEEMGAPEEASGAEATLIEPAETEPEPVRPPTETGERRRPDVTRNAVPIRPPVQPRPTPPRTAQAQPRTPPQPRPQPRPNAQQGQAQGQRSRGFDPRRLAESLGRGPPEARGTSPDPPAQLTGAQRQQIARNISGLIAPCAARAQAPNALARSISVDLRVTVTEGGVPTGHQLLASSGTNASNRDYVDDVVAVAMRAVRACSTRIATLPDDHYAVAGGWRTFRYRFRFPG